MSAQEFLDRADALAAGATDGPWVGPDSPDQVAAVWTIGEGVEGGGIVVAYDEYPRGGNRPMESLAFIAASRTLVPAMSAALRAVLDRCLSIEADARGGQKWAAEENDGAALRLWQERESTAAEIRRLVDLALGRPS